MDWSVERNGIGICLPEGPFLPSPGRASRHSWEITLRTSLLPTNNSVAYLRHCWIFYVQRPFSRAC